MELKTVTKQLKGMRLHLIPTDKFKTITIFLQLKAPLRKEEVSKRALLSYVLKSATAKSPTTKALRQRLDDLYGASMSTFLSKKGNFHNLSIRLDTANERFLKESSSLLDQTIEMLGEVLLNPLTKGNSFDPETVKKEKRSLIQRIQSVQDDKMRYASQRLVDEMCENEVYHLHTYGYKEDVEQLTPEMLYDYYQHMLQNDEVDIYVVGDIDSKEIEKAISQTITLPEKNFNSDRYESFEPVHVKKEKIVKEAQAIEQGKLNLGYRTNVVIGDDEYYASQVFNGLFGGFPHSKLFMNVREKASLAYYAVSRYESYKGLMLVMSGIEFSNYEQAVSIIEKQLTTVQNGDFTDNEIEQTKALLKNSVLEALDNPNAIVDFLYNEVLSGMPLNVEEYLKGIDHVTREEIINVAMKTELDTIYFLHGEEGQ